MQCFVKPVSFRDRFHIALYCLNTALTHFNVRCPIYRVHRQKEQMNQRKERKEGSKNGKTKIPAWNGEWEISFVFCLWIVNELDDRLELHCLVIKSSEDDRWQFTLVVGRLIRNALPDVSKCRISCAFPGDGGDLFRLSRKQTNVARRAETSMQLSGKNVTVSWVPSVTCQLLVLKMLYIVTGLFYKRKTSYWKY